MRNFHQLFALCNIIVFFLCIGCANRQSPSGGPDDKTGPSPVTTSPLSESVGVKTDASVEIVFSEWILPASVKGISIFPPTPLKTKVKGKRLLVRPLKRLNDSTTYHLVVTSGLKDLRNNPIGKPLSIIFSTGPSLDSGSIDGCVSDPGRKELQPNVALFRAPFQEGDSGFCGTPSYLTQTDSNGFFSFTHIRTGTYHLLAYLDKNSDYHLKGGDEDVYLPTDSLVTIGDTKKMFMLYPGLFDTTRQAIASVTAINNRTIIGNWKKPFDSLVNVQQPVFRLEPFDSTPTRITAALRQKPGSAKFILTLDTALDSVSYRLIYTTRSIFDTAAICDTLRIDGATPVDTTAPSLIRSSPDKQADLRPSLLLVWSEPVQLTVNTLTLADTLGDTVRIAGDTAFTDTSRLVVPRSLVPGNRYRMVLLTHYGKDLRGNELRSRDSTDTAAIVTFNVIHVDSLAVSLSGNASCLDTSVNRKWTFSRLSSGPPHFTVQDAGNSFRFDSIPSGKGTISTFIDNNGNGIPDPGRLFPFVPPEPVIQFPDTIEARARWDVEGVDLAPCDPCERKRLESAKAAATAEKDSSEAKKSEKK